MAALVAAIHDFACRSEVVDGRLIPAQGRGHGPAMTAEGTVKRSASTAVGIVPSCVEIDVPAVLPVMLGEGPAPTPLPLRAPQGVDGGPSTAMTTDAVQRSA